MSLDGFITAPNDNPGQRLGEGGEVLHRWGCRRDGVVEGLTGLIGGFVDLVAVLVEEDEEHRFAAFAVAGLAGWAGLGADGFDVAVEVGRGSSIPIWRSRS
jgi:hypothetical protein